MSDTAPTIADTLLESMRARQRELELEIVAIKARHDEISLTIAMYTSRPRGGRRGPKTVVSLNEELRTRLIPFTDADPPESAA